MMKLLSLDITKMSGAGNTFAIVEACSANGWATMENKMKFSRSQFAKIVCDKVQGLATDGFLIIEKGSDGIDFNWDFYNSDGSSAEMCGNAARCAARYCKEYLRSDLLDIYFGTLAGPISTKVLPNFEVMVRMPEVSIVNKNLVLNTSSGSTEHFVLVNTGVPHLVKKIPQNQNIEDLKEIARECRFHSDLKPKGANVTFFSARENHINAVTFERGVEDFTLACGTGAVAAAMVFSVEIGLKKIDVHMPGGKLKVEFLEGDAHPLMLGEAIFLGNFQFNLEVFNERF